jgi:O6-methylguanine-DNA--protein-cysteine methyltransferase
MRQDLIQTDWEQQQIDRLDSEQFWQTPFTPKEQNYVYWDQQMRRKAEQLDRWCLREKLRGSTYGQIAQQLGNSHAETARKRVCRAMGRLRQSQPEVYQYLKPLIWRNET